MSRPIKHGEDRRCGQSPEYRSWAHMLNRCYCSTAHNYARYGGRGITVCSRWRGENGFSNFLADMGRRPTPAHTLDRYPNINGNYEPGNCRWATPKQQQRNTRNTTLITAFGETLSIGDWSDKLGCHKNTIRDRLAGGMAAEQAVSIPVDTSMRRNVRKVPSQ